MILRTNIEYPPANKSDLTNPTNNFMVYFPGLSKIAFTF